MKVMIEVFASSECNKCSAAKKLVGDTIAAFNDARLESRVVDVVEDIDYAVSLGVLATPSIAINGKLVFTSIPSKQILASTIQKYLAYPNE